MPAGVLIVFDGPDGAGKSTQIRRTARWLRSQGLPVSTTAEPDGSGLPARRWLERGLSPVGELLLFALARAEHVRRRLRPWLEAGRIVLCDRFSASTYAYQGYGLGLPLDLIRRVDAAARQGVRAHLTVLLDAGEAESARRLRRKRPDRIERRDAAFRRRVRRGYAQAPGPTIRVPSRMAPSAVQAAVRQAIWPVLRRAGQAWSEAGARAQPHGPRHPNPAPRRSGRRRGREPLLGEPHPAGGRR